MMSEFLSGARYPEGWIVRRVSSLCGDGGLFTDGDWIESPYITDTGIRLIQTGNVGVGFYKEQGFRYISERTFEQLRCTAVEPGDILICRLADPVGRACIAPDLGVNAITSVDNVILRLSRDHDPQFMVYTFSSKPYLDYLAAECRGGTRNRVSRSFLGRLRLPLPDLAIQKAIAAFLDAETARIDALIENKERFEQGLRERTGSLLDSLTFANPAFISAPRVPLKWICRIPQGQVGPRDPAWNSMPLIAPNHLESATGRLLDYETAEEQGAISGKYAFPEGTVLYSKIRPALCKACISPVSGLCSADMYPLIPSKKLLPDFLLMQLLSREFTDWAVLQSMRVAMPKVNRETLGTVRLVVPTLEQQAEAVTVYQSQITAIEKTRATLTRSVERLREFRSALITAAVTGQIDPAEWRRRGEGDRRLERIEAEMAS